MHVRRGNIARLNYGVLSLIPKIKGAINIKQFRPIAVLNVIYRGITNVLTSRLAPVAHAIINPCQTGFIKGRYILEGIVVVHEVLHEIRCTKGSGILLKLDFENAYDRVDWEFLEEVMIRKGFGRQWIQWVMKTVRHGHLAININGEQGPFFQTSRGVRQGDPLSPILFDLVTDALASLIDSAKSAGHITGLVPHLIDHGLSLLQYADDTIIMMENTDANILHMKFLLYCFESMSGMKINYHKSEVVVLGCDQREQERVANMLNCRLGALPMNYLGVPIGDHRLTNEQLLFLIEKLSKRMDPWQGSLMSSSARLTLSNACLDNIPMFVMAFYLLGEGVHGEMDEVRGRFFWEGCSQSFKYHMMRWENVCRPKDYGGLGLINTRLMNICMLSKWI